MISIDQADELSTRDVEALYAEYVNPRQVSLFRRLSPSRDQVRSADGCWLTLKSGRRILDLTGGIGVLGHGHNHPKILKARRDFSSKKRMEVYKSYLSPYSAVLAHNIAEVLPGDLQYSYFPNSGAEAVEGALKMAYKFHAGNRDAVLVADIGFHGKTIGAGSLTQSKENSFRFPQIPNVYSAKYGSIESWVEAFSRMQNTDGSSRIYAVVIEPLSSSSMTEAPAEFLNQLRDLCDRFGAVLIFDEVYTGWGRTGYLFNFMRVRGLIPDILVYAKTLGGGKGSISGYTARKHIYKGSYDTTLSDSTLHSTTYFGLAEETITSIEAVRVVIEENFAERAQQIGDAFGSGLSSISGKFGWFSEVRSFGALNGFIPEVETIEKAVAGLGKLLGDGLVPQPRELFAGRLVSTAATEYLYREAGILTYIGFNVGSPLKISFPLVAKDRDVNVALDAMNELFRLNGRDLVTELLRIVGKK